MRSYLVILFVLSISCLAILAERCPKLCTSQNIPVCAAYRKDRRRTVTCTFRNECRLRNIMCTQNQIWELQSRQACLFNSRECDPSWPLGIEVDKILRPYRRI
ncbi:uncharacterized protein Dwil_GK27427 [Drosophila willistoni]|uniref:Kazal-like domain-containing protein n=1 Tax=Drosophila willistoni TaxID=7260 RepID=A0A0Q9X3E3_DROWI|nr:uncharacterized protein Dwil_GK27427 [Drosophila willistoni]